MAADYNTSHIPLEPWDFVTWDFVPLEPWDMDELDAEEFFEPNGFKEVDKLDILPYDKFPLRCRYPRVNKWLDSRRRVRSRYGGAKKVIKKIANRRIRHILMRLDDDFEMDGRIPTFKRCVPYYSS